MDTTDQREALARRLNYSMERVNQQNSRIAELDKREAQLIDKLKHTTKRQSGLYSELKQFMGEGHDYYQSSGQDKRKMQIKKFGINYDMFLPSQTPPL